MDFWLVVTVFQGLFDDVTPFKTEKEADEFIQKLKDDWVDEPDLGITKKCIEI
jgi:hypothetical protein